MHRGISYMRASHPGGAERRRWMRGRGRMLRGWAEKGQERRGLFRSLRQDRGWGRWLGVGASRGLDGGGLFGARRQVGGWGGGSERIEGRSGSSRVLRFSLVRA